MHLGVVPGYLPAWLHPLTWFRGTLLTDRGAPRHLPHRSCLVDDIPCFRLKMQPHRSRGDATPAKVTEIAAAGSDPLPLGAPKLVNPFEYAQSLKARAAADLASATKALQEHSQRKYPNS